MDVAAVGLLASVLKPSTGTVQQPFDPYAEWLGIPSGRPASYYDLLGLELFEDDPERIAQSADRCMMQVRRIRPGPRLIQWQEVLDALSEAKATLLNPVAKAHYDFVLRSGQQEESAQEAPPPRPTCPARRGPSPVAMGLSVLMGLLIAVAAALACRLLENRPFQAQRVARPATNAAQPPLGPPRDSAPAASPESLPQDPLRGTAAPGCAGSSAQPGAAVPPSAPGSGTNSSAPTLVSDEVKPTKSPVEEKPAELPRAAAAAVKPAEEEAAPPQASPPPADTPAPEPSADPKKQKLFAAAAKMAHAGLARHDQAAVRRSLRSATANAQTEAEKTQMRHLESLLGLLGRFWDGIGRTVLTLEAGEEFVLGEERIVVVEVNPERLTIRARGRNREYPLRLIPAVLVRSLAERQLDQPEGMLHYAAYLAVDRQGDLARARELWQKAAEAGIEIEPLPQVDWSAFEAGREKRKSAAVD